MRERHGSWGKRAKAPEITVLKLVSGGMVRRLVIMLVLVALRFGRFALNLFTHILKVSADTVKRVAAG